MRVLAVKLWGTRIGALAWPAGEPAAAFEYEPSFVGSGIQVAPLMMPLAERVYSFPGLPEAAFRGLPGLVADVLPDRYGHALIDTWLARQGRDPSTFGALDRLAYIGNRAMGALAFEPAEAPSARAGESLDVAALVALANEVLQERQQFSASLQEPSAEALRDILQVGTSAGGARAKALIAWNAATGEVRSGQTDAGTGFSQWLLKFDGITNNRDKELADPQGFGVIELAYHHMAVAAGITMSPCRLLDEGGRRHFMTRRFDRTDDGGRLHLQSLAALAHLDFNAAGAHGYEVAFDVMRRLGLGAAEREQQFRRMVFNVVARNQDDHVKNIAFLMDRTGRWSLSPAYDVTWSYNPSGAWTASHQMTVNGKRDGFDRTDLEAVGRVLPLKRGRASQVLDEVVEAVRAWPQLATQAGVASSMITTIAASHRLRW